MAADDRLLTRETGRHFTPRLTPREVAVLRLLADGLTAAAIARALSVSERTVHKHLQHLYSKLGVSDRLSAVLHALELELLGPVLAADG